MKIWYLNHYAKPAEFGTPGRSFYLARYLDEQGHDALIVAASEHHTRIRPAPVTDINTITTYDDVRYFHIPTRPYSGNGASRLLNMHDFVHGIDRLKTEVVNNRVEKPDAIIASSAHIFVYPPAYRLAKTVNSKIIFEVRDIWPLSLVELAGVRRWNPLIWWMSMIERKAYSTADAVVSLVPKANEHMERLGLKSNKYNYITNGVDSKEWSWPYETMPALHQRAFDDCRSRGKFIIVYAGAHGLPNALDQVLDLNKVIGKEVPPYHFIFIGDGVCKEALMHRVNNECIEYVTFLPRITKKQILTALLQADCCFIGWQKKNIYRYGISPNKLGDYFMAGKPVLHAVVAGNDPVAEANAGYSMEPYNPIQLDQSIRKLINMGPEGRSRMGARGKHYALENIEWSILGRRYEMLLRLLMEQIPK